MASRVKRDHHLWTRDTIKNVSGDVTLDLAGDLTIDVAGGQCTITDNTVSDPDLILLGTSGLTSGPQFYIKHDSSSPAINDYPGAIYIQGKDDAGNTQTYGQITCQIKAVVNGSELSKVTIGAASPTVGGFVLEGISEGRVDVDLGLGSASVTTIAGNIDIDGDTITTAGALTLDIAGDLTLDASSGIFHFQDAADSDDAFKITVVGGTGATTLETVSAAADGNLILQPAGYITLKPSLYTMTAAPIGFTQDEPTFDNTDTIVTFSTKGNKAKVTLTDNCTDIHFKFPPVSGNFLCVLLQDGTGGRTISNWKTQDSAGNAGAGNSGLVLFAGGTDPSNTETADKADIISFYWDAGSEIAYGTYTYNF